MEDSTLKLFANQFASSMIAIFAILAFFPILLLLLLGGKISPGGSLVIGIWGVIWCLVALVVSVANAKYGFGNIFQPSVRRTIQLMMSSFVIAISCPVWW